MAAKNSLADISTGILDSYGISATKIRPAGPIWKIYSSSGVFALKRTRRGTVRILKLAQIIRYLRESGFSNLMEIINAKSGLPYATIQNDHFLLSPWLDGETPDFTNWGHLRMVAETFGRFHRISQNIVPAFAPGIIQPPIKSLLDEFRRKNQFLIGLSNALSGRNGLNRIDRLILKWSDHFIRQADFCIGRLMKCPANEWDKKNTLWGFCHNDPAPRNIIINDRESFLIDFELADEGMLVKEVAKLLVRALIVNRWSPEIIDMLIEAYTAERVLNPAEWQLLPYMCAFPQSFWRLCSQRFEERLPWTQTRFQKRLWEITSAEPIRIQCLVNMLPELHGLEE